MLYPQELWQLVLARWSTMRCGRMAHTQARLVIWYIPTTSDTQSCLTLRWQLERNTGFRFLRCLRWSTPNRITRSSQSTSTSLVPAFKPAFFDILQPTNRCFLQHRYQATISLGYHAKRPYCGGESHFAEQVLCRLVVALNAYQQGLNSLTGGQSLPECQNLGSDAPASLTRGNLDVVALIRRCVFLESKPQRAYLLSFVRFHMIEVVVDRISALWEQLFIYFS